MSLQVALHGFLLKQQLLDARRREAFGAAVNRAPAASELQSRRCKTTEENRLHVRGPYGSLLFKGFARVSNEASAESGKRRGSWILHF